MKLKIKYLTASIGLVFFVVVLQAQPTSLDPTFEIKPDYGALYRVEKAWSLADGSVLCHTKKGNFFEGRKTGPFFKLLANGDLDTNYSSPLFTHLCEPGMCSCYYIDTATLVLSDGRIFVSNWKGLTINGTDQDHKVWLFTKTGSIDTSFHVGSNYQGFNQLVSLDTAGFLQIFPDSIVHRNTRFGPMPLFQSYSLPPNWRATKFEQGDKAGTYFFRLDSAQKQAYLPYAKGSHTFGQPFPISKQKERFPIQIGTDRSSRIYEMYFSADTISGVVYNRIVRKNRFGSLDTHFNARVRRINQYTAPKTSTDSLGRVTVYISPEMTLRFDDSTGSLLDSSFGNPNITLRSGNELIELGKNALNRWAFVRKTITGNLISERATQWGASHAVQKVLVDPTGKILILGKFRDFDGWESPGLARVLPGGRVDISFRCTAMGVPSKGSWLAFSQRPDGKLIVVNSYSFGSKNRFIYCIHPNGTWDSSFAASNLGGFSYPVRVIHSATVLKSGAMFLVVAFQNDTIAAKTFVVKLLPNGERDPGFTIREAADYFSISTGLSPVYGPFLATISQQNDSIIFLALQKVYSTETGVCKSATPVTTQELEYHGILIDTTGELLTNIPAPYGRPVYIPVPRTDSAFPSFFLRNDYLNATHPGYNGMFKLMEDFQMDLGYRVQNPEGGSPGSWYSEPVLVTTSDDVFYTSKSGYFTYPWEEEIYYLHYPGDYLSKTNPDGVVDTVFVNAYFNHKINAMIEPDSLHLYVAGNFTQYKDRTTPYLIRLANAPSTMVTSRLPTKSSDMGLYPNPVRETLYINNWQPGIRLLITNLQGKIIFNEEVSGSVVGQAVGRQPGIYFWTLIQNGTRVAGGKLIRE